MRVDVTLDEKDYLEHIRFYFRQTPGGIQVMRQTDRRLWMIIVYFPVLVGMVLLMADRRQEAIFASLATLVCLAALYPLFRHSTRRRILQNSLTVLRSDSNALFFLPSTVEITPEHFIRETELSYTRIAWKVIENIYETPTHLFVFLGSAMGTNTIPLRCFKTPQDASAFAITARQYFDAAKATR